MNELDGMYRILGTLATGGTAVLFKAVQTSLDRPVVIKRLHAHLTADPDFTRRFELEAKAAARLDHPNIVRIIDFGASGKDHYIVMEYIDGPSLKDVLAARPVLGDELALLVAREICLGLDHAHRRGIVHRDIKPANVMIGRNGRVVITDFGLAKLRLPEKQETVASTLLGTPLYMSPEQAIGEAVDGRSDLFSLGTICYEALTGKQPFLGGTYAAVIQRILGGAPAAPRRYRDDIRPETEAIVMKAIARDPSKRFRDAAEMARAIESALGETVVASARERIVPLARNDERDPPPSPRRRRPRRRRPASRAIALIAGTTALLAIAALRSTDVGSLSRSIRAGLAGPVAPRRETMSAGMEERLASVTMTPIDAPAPPSDSLAPDPATERTPMVSSAAGEPSSDPAPEDTAAPAAEAPDTICAAAVEPDSASSAAAAEATSTPRPAERRGEPKTRTGFIDIAVDPPSSIIIDGEPQTASGRLSMFELEAGAHEIACRREGYRDYVETVWITSAELSRRRIVLQEITGSLEIASEQGARLYVDGAYRGTLPLPRSVALAPGAHHVLLQKPGYHPWSTDVHVSPDEPLRIAIRLVPVSENQ